MDERERRLMEKRYQLPDNPELVVHPSRTAKSGKFFCNAMSLSILLDYRPEDSKEHSFEVSLFAELFNEMLMRDFGFNIYKALYALPEAVEKEKDDKKSTKDSDEKENANDCGDNKEDGSIEPKPENANEKDKEKEKEKDKDKEKEKEKDKEKEKEKDKSATDSEKEKDKKSLNKTKDRGGDRERDRGDRRRRKNDETDEDSFSTKSGDTKRKEKDRQKYTTSDPELLLSFVYFDQTHCGYIFEKDIEDLFHTLGLGLSRAQTRKLASKVISRDSLFYR